MSRYYTEAYVSEFEISQESVWFKLEPAGSFGIPQGGDDKKKLLLFLPENLEKDVADNKQVFSIVVSPDQKFSSKCNSLKQSMIQTLLTLKQQRIKSKFYVDLEKTNFQMEGNEEQKDKTNEPKPGLKMSEIKVGENSPDKIELVAWNVS